MKTYVVRAAGKTWMGNAESPEEAVAYARAKGDIYADRYWVADWDANTFVIEHEDALD
ncbi:MAG TPA: hypothetical protein VGJ60_20390 [Chloroflexota bacterium]